ncbi:MAG TPA: FAD-binding oxidoreductase [Solirubrobacteraceae bacterium]|jgi:FAD/FMN-containing dehydrogenase|nr:FAD-binding oxidoreductase [Solirubrobacteraceae bacterium]
MTSSVFSETAVDELSSSFGGELLREGDGGYDEARMVWNGCFDRRPGLIARCTSVEDVRAAVDFGRENGLTVAVRAGGHSAQGYGMCDDGLAIDLSPLKAIDVDPEARTVRAQGGVTWGEFDAATQEHGLAVTGGRFSTTGIAGLTLASGSGWLERRCGLTGDNLLSAEVVTADGAVLTASATENPDLFWGLRGGGGNFGIVTSFTYRLHEIGPLIYGGLLACMPDRAGETLRFLSEYMVDAPDDLGCAGAFVSAPPEPFVPEEMHFAPIFGLVVCWSGDIEEGEEVLAPIREVAQPVMDLVQPMPYTALQSMLDGGAPHGTRAYFKAEFLPELGDEVIERMVAHGASRPGPMDQLLLEPMGGAMTRIDRGELALGRRDAPWCYHALAMWTDPGEEEAEAHTAWARALAADVAPYATTGAYLNFTSDEGEDRVRRTFGAERYARLVALKDRYDPTNLFHLNQNIRPSA